MDPVVLNTRPAEGAESVDGLAPLKFSVRDEDTRVAGASVRALMAYYRIVYEGDQLPSRDPALRRGDGRGFEGRFSDATPVPPLGDFASFTLVPSGLRIQKTAGTDQESFIFVSDRLVADTPVSVEVTLEVPAATAAVPGGTLGISDLNDFTGIVVGLMNWRRKSGAYVLFMDDGITKMVTLAGPALSAAGDRTLLAAGYPFDWGAGVVTIRLMWDDTPGSQAIILEGTDATGTKNVAVFPGAAATLAATPFLGGIRLAGMETSGPPADVVTAVVGTAGPTVGDAIVVHRVAVSGFAAAMALGGGPTPWADLQRAGNAAVAFRTDSVDWEVDDGSALTVSSSEGSVVLENGAGASALLSRAEMDVVHKAWLLVARLSVPVTGDLGGDVRVGPEFRVDDASDVFVLSCVQSVDGERYVGLRTSSSSDMTGFLVDSAVDWSRPVTLAMLGSSALNFTRVEVDDVESVSASYAGGASDITTVDARVGLGWSEGNGTMRVAGMAVFPNAVFAEPWMGLPTALAAQGWVLVGAAAAVASSRYAFPAATAGAQSFYYVSPADYEPEAGGAWFVRGRVTDWVDAYGTPRPLGAEIGPIFLVQHNTTKAAGVSFVEVEGGRGFVFVAGTDADVWEVVRQTERGRRISAPATFGTDTTYLFEVLPGKHVRLYLDYAPTPAIDIPWAELVSRTSPSGVPAGAAGAFGSIDPSGAATPNLVFARFGYGRGYDFVLTPRLEDDALVEWVNGSDATLYVDTEDV